NLPKQPHSREGPVTLCGGRAHADHLRRFGHGETSEIAQLHQFRLVRMMPGKGVQSIMDIEEFAVLCGCGYFHVISIHALQASSVPGRMFAPCPVDEDAAHRLCRSAKELPAALPSMRFA